MIKETLVLILILISQAHAAPSVNSVSELESKKKAAKDMSFEDLLVSGQYHFSDEAVTTIEEDKVLNSLIGVRTDFKDRMKQSATLGEVKNK